MKGGVVLLTCEHGGNHVPRSYRELFDAPAAKRALASHRGYDPGAMSVARALARRLSVDLLAVSTTRLLVEPNRSLGHPKLFSEWSRALGPRQRDAAIQRHYLPHRRRVVEAVAEAAPRTVHHIAVHSFAPALGGTRRNADIGLLYDPARKREGKLCRRWREVLAAIDPALRVRLNYPYRGKSDGLTTALRRQFPAPRYLGIELEINQALLGASDRVRRRTTETLGASLELLFG